MKNIQNSTTCSCRFRSISFPYLWLPMDSTSLLYNFFSQTNLVHTRPGLVSQPPIACGNLLLLCLDEVMHQARVHQWPSSIEANNPQGLISATWTGPCSSRTRVSALQRLT